MKTVIVLLVCLAGAPLLAQLPPGTSYKVFQFPADRIPTIDGKTDDWKMVPEEYAIGGDRLLDTGLGKKHDPADLDVKVKVGWVKGLNRLYFLYEAYDNYWDFSNDSLHNDIFEVVVDGDMSGGPLIRDMHPFKGVLDRWTAYAEYQSVYAQNYHIFTPPGTKEWVMIWGCQSWLRDLPHSNYAYSYDFKPGESGRLVLEFWITPFDLASCKGPKFSTESELWEDKLIGLSWSILDYDDKDNNRRPFWNLSHQKTMYGDASVLVPFRLMPLEAEFRKPLEVKWTARILDVKRRQVAFQDESTGKITKWRWIFGDGATSEEQHPVHQYSKGGNYTVTLEVSGGEHSARLVKVWEVVLP